MVLKTIAQSDISGQDIPDEQHARIVITDHPGLTTTVELDASVEEAAQFQAGRIELVTLKIYEPNADPRVVVLDANTFAKAFKGKDVDDVLSGARKSDERPRYDQEPPRQRRARTASSANQGEKRDYKSPEFAGLEHRGRVTEAEAEWVRNNLDLANANREKHGQAPIDPDDAKYKKRYGF